MHFPATAVLVISNIVPRCFERQIYTKNKKIYKTKEDRWSRGRMRK